MVFVNQMMRYTATDPYFFVLILRYTEMAPCALVIVSTSNLSINDCLCRCGGPWPTKHHLALLNEKDMELVGITIILAIVTSKQQ